MRDTLALCALGCMITGMVAPGEVGIRWLECAIVFIIGAEAYALD